MEIVQQIRFKVFNLNRQNRGGVGGRRENRNNLFNLSRKTFNLNLVKGKYRQRWGKVRIKRSKNARARGDEDW